MTDDKKRIEEIRQMLSPAYEGAFSDNCVRFLLAHIDAQAAKLALVGAFIAKLTNETHTVTGTACREDGDVLEWTEQRPTLLATEARALLVELRKG